MRPAICMVSTSHVFASSSPPSSLAWSSRSRVSRFFAPFGLPRFAPGLARELRGRPRAPTWIRELGMLDPARLVFIDETAVSTNMVRLGGRAPRGLRLIGRVPLGTWETITFVAALRHNKMTAPMVINGAMSGETFLAYVEQCLVPTLRRNDIVVMDNLRATKFQAFERRSRKRDGWPTRPAIMRGQRTTPRQGAPRATARLPKAVCDWREKPSCRAPHFFCWARRRRSRNRASATLPSFQHCQNEVQTGFHRPSHRGW